jgi:hypothetical protein
MAVDFNASCAVEKFDHITSVVALFEANKALPTIELNKLLH